jgi:conjugal transfer pilus assembly protein TraE
MNHQLLQSKLSKLSARLNFMVVLVLGLLISNVGLSYFAVYALKNQKREVVPFVGNSGYVISDTEVDGHYLNLMAENFIYARLNVTPKSVKQNHKHLLDYIDSSIYSSFKEKLQKEEQVIQKKEIASSFDMTDVQSDNQALVSKVTGHLKRHVGYRALPEADKTYLIKYKYQLGKLTITGFSEFKGEGHES